MHLPLELTRAVEITNTLVEQLSPYAEKPWSHGAMERERHETVQLVPEANAVDSLNMDNIIIIIIIIIIANIIPT